MVEAMEIQTGFKQTEVGVIPSDWKVKKLSEIGESIIGLTYSPANVKSHGTLVLRSSNVQNGKLAFKNNVFVEMDLPKRVIVKENDILICVRNGSRQLIGKCALIDKKTAGSAFGAFMSVYRSEFSVFAFYQFQSFFIQKQINETLGATINQITNKDLARFQIPFPPTKTEQTAIATALNDADALITQLEKLIAKKRAIKQGAMQELLKPKEGWEEKTLGVECELITKGTTPTSVGRDFQSSGINFIKIESLTENGKIIKDKVAFIDSYTNSLLKRSQLKSGDTLFSIAGALGRVAIISNKILPANTNQALAIIRLKNDTEIELKYLFYFLNSRKIQIFILAINVQGAQANLSLQNVSDLPIKYPLRTEQIRIARTLSDMDAEIEVLEKKLNKYRMLKQGVMQNLLTGRIRLV